MSVVFRRAHCEDISHIHNIEIVCFKQPWSFDSFYNDICENAYSFYVVAEDNGIMAGYCGVHIIDNEGHILNVAVLPEFRKRGIGCGLLETLFIKTGLPFYTLEVRVSNEEAISLYTKLGFVTHGKRPRYYGNEDALIMWKGKNAP